MRIFVGNSDLVFLPTAAPIDTLHGASLARAVSWLLGRPPDKGIHIGK